MNIKFSFLHLALFLLSIDFIQCDEQLAPIVKIAQGELQGVVVKSRDKQDYYAYWGIPFAKPPKRFQAPEPATVPGWEGTRNATIPPSICLQQDFFVNNQIVGSEDCLFVNVFTTTKPSEAKAKLKPVIVYIHGGGFYNGAGGFQGAGYFMDEPVVLANFNYRLSALGFLNIDEWSDSRNKSSSNISSEDFRHVANGNMGLKDQVLALKWVQDNIKAFGGDPSKVTIFGTSAGGASVSLHLLSPLSKGLFHRAIAASGSAMNDWAMTKESPDFFVKKLGKSLNCPVADSNELIKCLLEKDTTDIIANSVITTVWPLDPSYVFRPSVESRNSRDGAFMIEKPKTLLKKGQFHKVPLIIGVAKNEGLFFQAGRILTDKNLTRALNDNWNKIAPVTFGLDQDISEVNLDEASIDVRAFYLGAKCLSLNETAQQLEDLYSDRGFIYGVRQNVLYQAKHSPVYPYIFDYAGDGSVLGRYLFGDAINLTDKMLHGDDIKYGFDSGSSSSVFTTLADNSVDFSKKYVKLLVSFADTGEPEASVFGENVAWPATSAQQANGEEPLQWFHLDSEPFLEAENFTGRMIFWDHLLEKYA